MIGTRRTPLRNHFIRLVRYAGVAAVLATVTASACPNDSPTGVDPVKGFTITIIEPIAVAFKGKTEFTVRIAREPGFTGAIELGGSVDNAADGVLILLATVPGGSGVTTATMSMTTEGRTGTLQTFNLFIHGTAAGYKAEEANAKISILKAGAFDLAKGDENLFANPGFTFRKRILILRDQYPGAITFKMDRPDLNAPTTFTPATTTGNFVDVDVSVGASQRLGDGGFLVIGTGADGIAHEFQVNMYVRLPSYSIVATGPPASVIAGTSSQAFVTAIRDPGFSGVISLDGNQRAEFTFTPTTIQSSATQTTIGFQVAGFAAPGAQKVVVFAKSSGQEDQATTFDIFVRGFTISPASATQDFPVVTAGGPVYSEIVKINRTEWTDAVTLSGKSVDGITLTADPASTTGNQTTASVTVASSVVPGNYQVVLTATSGTVRPTAVINLTVKAPDAAPPPPPPPPPSPTLAVNPAAISISALRQSTLSAVVTNGLNVTDVTWASSDPTIATVGDNGSRSVLISALKAGGPVTITGSYAYFGGIATATSQVTVTGVSTAQVASITIEPATPTVAIGGQVQFRVRYFTLSGAETNAEVGSTTIFTNTSSGVASIGSSTGLLTAKSAGQSQVTASYHGTGAIMNATTAVTVP